MFVAITLFLLLCPSFLFGGEIPLRILQGLFFGYFNASISESLIHNFFGHAPKWLRKSYKKCPQLFRWLKWTYESHTEIHHGRTHKKEFTTQFETVEQERELLESLLPWQRVQVKITQFGLTIGFESFPYFIGPPAFIGLPIVYFLSGGIATITASLLLFAPPLVSMCVHPFIHKPYEQVLAEATGITKLWMKTSYYRSIVRQHWIHHKYPRYNFNLVPGGDELLGTYRAPGVRDLEQMSRLGIPMN